MKMAWPPQAAYASAAFGVRASEMPFSSRVPSSCVFFFLTVRLPPVCGRLQRRELEKKKGGGHAREENRRGLLYELRSETEKEVLPSSAVFSLFSSAIFQ